MKTGTAIAFAAVAIVLIAIGAAAWGEKQRRELEARRSNDPGQQIGAGLGMLVGGIIGAATS